MSGSKKLLIAAALVAAATVSTFIVVRSITTARAASPYRCPNGIEAVCKNMTASKLKPLELRVVGFEIVAKQASDDPVARELMAQKMYLEIVVPTRRKHRADILTDKIDDHVVWKPIGAMQPIDPIHKYVVLMAEQLVWYPLGYKVDGEKYMLEAGDKIAKIEMLGPKKIHVVTYAIFSRRGTLKFEFYTAWLASYLLEPKSVEAAP